MGDSIERRLRQAAWRRTLGALVFAGLSGLPVAAGAWEVRIDGPQSENDEARALALDPRGFVFAGGGIEAAGDRWLVVKLAPGDGREIWRASPSGTLPFPWAEQLNDLAVDADGDAVAVGAMRQDESDFAIVKLRGTDGAERWRVVLDEPALGSRESGTRVAIDAAGDVIAAGYAELGPPTGTVWSIVKLRGSDGELLWSRQVAGTGGGFGYVHDLGLTGGGDVVAVGMTTNAGTASDLTAVKLGGADGGLVWRTDIDGNGSQLLDYAEGLAIDAAGHVYAAGRLADSYASAVASRFAVVKLASGDGSLLWRGDLCCGADRGAARAIALTDDGGVIVGGESRRQHLDSAFTVARFDAATGGRDWLVVLAGPTGYGRVNAVAADARGDVWAAGQIETTAAGKSDALLVKIHPCGVDEPCNELDFSYDAEVVEERRTDGSSTAEDDYDEFLALVMGDENAPVVAGPIYENHPEVGAEEPHLDFAVARVSESGRNYGGPDPFVPACDDGADNDADGATDLEDGGCSDADDLFEQPGSTAVRTIGGRRMLAKDRFGNPRARKLSLDSRDATVFVPAAGGASDPTLHGAVLELVNPTTGERSFAALPAAGWSGLGEPAGAAGYRYRDSSREAGPCRSVELRAARLRASCGGRRISFSLDEPSQGRLGGRLHLAGGDRLCMEFGGAVQSDVSTVAGGTGLFRADDAPAPADCP